MKYKQYQKYKDSGIEWIGEIPEGWEVRKIRHLGYIETSSVDKKIKEDEKPIKLANYLDIYQNERKIIDSQTKFTKTSCSQQQAIQNNLIEGDVLFTPSSETVEEIGFSAVVNENLIDAVYSYHIIRLRFKKNIFKNFKKYLFNNNFTLNHFSKNARGTTRQTLKIIDFQNTNVIIPSYEEQKQISEFLDKETKHLDDLISKSQSQINLLQEKRQATINQAVTKGLDPSVPMKDSGIEWIGEIPEGWDIVPFKQILTQKMDNGIFKKKNQFGDGALLINVGDLYQEDGVVNQQTLDRVMVDDDERKKYAVIPNDIFFVRSSLKLEGIGISSIVKDIVEPMVFECHIVRTRPNQQKINPIYLKYLLNSSKFRSYFVSVSQTVTMTTISQDHIKNLKIICPPILEENQIAKFLDKQTTQFDDLISKSQSQVKLLQEKRQALITSAVTGKIDVRNGVAA